MKNYRKNEITQLSRSLTVYKKFVLNGKNYTVVPEIRLVGKWLRVANFQSGQKIKIECKNNFIRIRNSEPILVTLDLL